MIDLKRTGSGKKLIEQVANQQHNKAKPAENNKKGTSKNRNTNKSSFK